jgi:hypothetical protein
MTHQEHRSIGGFLYEYIEGHREVSHGMFSTAGIRFGFICETPPGMNRELDKCADGRCDFDRCLQVETKVWLAPFDFGIMQQVAFKFRPAETEAGFLEIHMRLDRETGEANAWHRINKSFLHEIRKQLLIWRSFDDETKLQYEQLLLETEKEVVVSS